MSRLYSNFPSCPSLVPTRCNSNGYFFNYFQSRNSPFPWEWLLHGLGFFCLLTRVSWPRHNYLSPNLCKHSLSHSCHFVWQEKFRIAAWFPLPYFLLLLNLFCLPLKFKNVMRCYLHGTLLINYYWYSVDVFI